MSYDHAFDQGFSELSLELVNMIETRFSQNEQNATIEVGVVLGIFSSILILLFMCACNRCRHTRRQVEMPCGTTKEKNDIELSVESAVDGSGGEIESSTPASTEGFYRSDSDSDDEGASMKISKEAQKRSRSSNGV